MTKLSLKDQKYILNKIQTSVIDFFHSQGLTKAEQLRFIERHIEDIKLGEDTPNTRFYISKLKELAKRLESSGAEYSEVTLSDIDWIKDFNKRTESSGAEYSEVTLRKIFTQAGLNSDLTERAFIDYQRYRESELSFLKPLSGDEIRQIGAEALVDKTMNFKRGIDLVEEILRKYSRYLEYKEEIVEAYQESKDWRVVFSNCVYSDVPEAQEGFIDYVEETYQTKVKDGKHLQKLTGITHLDSWDSKAGKYITPDTEEEAKENAIRELEETLTGSRFCKYFRALEKAIGEGAKYKDLLQIKPQDFGLPKTWSGCLGSDQYSSILWALSLEFLIDEPAPLITLPDLRSIAHEIEAPYSVLMDCFKLFN